MKDSRRHESGRQLSRKGFTLLELLIVIVVIVILVGILMPAIHQMRRKGWEQETSVKCAAFALAFRNFHTEYGYWPLQNKPGGGSNSTIVCNNATTQLEIIQNYLLSSGGYNPNGKVFWEGEGVVSNVLERRPLVVTIDVLNDTVGVQ